MNIMSMQGVLSKISDSSCLQEVSDQDICENLLEIEGIHLLDFSEIWNGKNNLACSLKGRSIGRGLTTRGILANMSLQNQVVCLTDMRWSTIA